MVKFYQRRYKLDGWTPKNSILGFMSAIAFVLLMLYTALTLYQGTNLDGRIIVGLILVSIITPILFLVVVFGVVFAFNWFCMILGRIMRWKKKNE